MEADPAVTIDDLEADKLELRAMIEKASRANVRKELLRVLDKVEGDIRHMLVKGSLPQAPAVTPPSGYPSAPPAAQPAAAKVEEAPAVAAKPSAAPAPEHKPVAIDHRVAGPWTEITTFALDLGGYDKPHVAVDVRLKGIEALPKESVTCDFTESSFDLKVLGLDGVNYRMLKTNLDKDIVPSESSVKVKKNHVIVTMQKVKGSYGYDSWMDLCAKGGKRRAENKEKKAGKPEDSIMDMMKDLYDDGDDSMKKIIGEAMYKARRGEKMDPKDDKLPDMSKLGEDDE